MTKLIAAIDIETTGLSPQFHDIIEIAIQPLCDDFSLSPDIQPFTARIRARRPKNADAEALAVSGLDMTEGEDYLACMNRLMEWFTTNGIDKLCILGHNVEFDRAFIEAQMPELAKFFSYSSIRDSQRLAQAYNDLNVMMYGKPAFEKLGLTHIRAALGIEGSQAHRALDDAIDSAKVYKALMEKMARNMMTRNEA